MFNLDNCLYLKDKKLYEEISLIASKIYLRYSIPNNPSAMKAMIKQYAKANDVHVKILYVPLNDTQLWGIFYQLDGIYFIVINSEISINKQVVALAHEFYHFYSSVEENMVPLDILSDNIESDNIEDKKADAFAACYLMPELILKSSLQQPFSLEEKLLQIKLLMDAFIVPYKTAAIRLMEIGYISKEECLTFIDATTRDLRDILERVNSSKESRWDFINKNLIELDDLDNLLYINENLELMSSKKLKKQKEIVDKIKKELKGENNN